MHALFTNFAGRDFSLAAAASTAINKGVSALMNGTMRAAPANDLLRRARPSDGAFDIGAFERPGAIDFAAVNNGASLDADLDALNLLLTPDVPSPAQQAPPPTVDDGLGFLNDLHQTAQRLKTDLTKPPAPVADPEDDGLDFLGDLTRKTQQLKQQLKAEPPVAESPAAEDDGLGFLTDLNREARQLKRQLKAETPSAPYQPFTLDIAFCRCNDTSAATAAYVAFIDHEIKALHQSIRDQTLGKE
jgi:hypothetical protein